MNNSGLAKQNNSHLMQIQEADVAVKIAILELHFIIGKLKHTVKRLRKEE